MKQVSNQPAMWPVYPELGVFSDEASPSGLLLSGLGKEIVKFSATYPETIDKSPAAILKRLQFAELNLTMMLEF